MAPCRSPSCQFRVPELPLACVNCLCDFFQLWSWTCLAHMIPPWTGYLEPTLCSGIHRSGLIQRKGVWSFLNLVYQTWLPKEGITHSKEWMGKGERRWGCGRRDGRSNLGWYIKWRKIKKYLKYSVLFMFDEETHLYLNIISWSVNHNLLLLKLYINFYSIVEFGY